MKAPVQPLRPCFIAAHPSAKLAQVKKLIAKETTFPPRKSLREALYYGTDAP
jgi:hypothetical protein